MGDQVPLFPGNRGCGKRERPAAIVERHPLAAADVEVTLSTDGVTSRTTAMYRSVLVRLDGVMLESPNRSATVSRGARMAQNGRATKLRAAVKLHIVAAVGLDCAPPSRFVITRLSSSPKGLDDDNLVSSMKAVRDGIADAFKLNDRVFTLFGDPGKIPYEAKQATCKRGTKGVVIELFFSV